MVIYAVFTFVVGIHDAGEYITLAKEMAGIGNVEVFSTHSVVYSAFLALFLKVFPSMIMIKLVNTAFLVLIGLFLYKVMNEKKAFLVWMFSPLVWFVSIEVSPIFLVSFFVLLGYYLFDKWEKNGEHKNIFLILSGLCWGMTFSLWFPSVFLIFVFGIFFFWGKKFNEFILFLIGMAPSVLVRFIADYAAFGFPFHSLVKYVGATIVIHSGLGYNHLVPITLGLLLRILFFVAPLTILAFPIDYKRHKREIWLLVICAVFFFFRGGQPDAIKVFITFAPLWVIVVGRTLTWKKVFLNSLVGLVIVVFLTSVYFTDTHETDLQRDISQFREDFSFNEVLTGKDQALNFASASWTTEPRFLWWKEYELWKSGGEYYSSYSYTIDPNIDLHQILYMQVGLRRKNDRGFDGVPLVSMEKDKEYEGFYLVKEYPAFNVYLPEKNLQ